MPSFELRSVHSQYMRAPRRAKNVRSPPEPMVTAPGMSLPSEAMGR